MHHDRQPAAAAAQGGHAVGVLQDLAVGQIEHGAHKEGIAAAAEREADGKQAEGEEHRTEEGTEVAHAKAEQEISQKQQSAEQQPERKTAPKILFKFVPELLPQKHIALAHEHNESAVHGAQRSRHRHDRDAAGQKQQVQTDELPCMVPKQIEKPTRTLAGRGKAAAFPTHSALHQFFIPVITMPSTKYR